MEKIITLSSDFGKQTQGIGNMEGVIYGINPHTRVIHLMHGIPAFDLMAAARTMETVYHMPVGFHVCVVDPDVGTTRKGVIIKVKRGDYLIGPDNGCLMTAPRLLGGIERVVEITNEKFMIRPVSPIFHGRHIFAPAAAHLSRGESMDSFGKELNPAELVSAPYGEAVLAEKKIHAEIIHVHHFGSLHFNILHSVWESAGFEPGKKVRLTWKQGKGVLPVTNTFGEVAQGQPLIMKDDYQRIEAAVNQGSFAQKYGLGVGDKITIEGL
ncbi:MAG: SAM-dependent chlorinase/fluorinase [Candidatus Diapherotrites archaeon]|nr:SAM-dependent chlorinase/fluorinase [Candidatus Diapherotrites archaeon]